MLAILGIIGYISYLKRQNIELYSQLSDKNNKYDKLYSEYKKLQDVKLKDKLKSLPDNQEVEKRHKCQVCDSTENVKYFATSGYIENENGKTYLSGGVYICEECLSICEKCDKCGKLKMSMVIEPLFGSLMKCDLFCECSESAEDKELRYKREARRYEILQGKKRLEKLKEMYLQ